MLPLLRAPKRGSFSFGKHSVLEGLTGEFTRPVRAYDADISPIEQIIKRIEGTLLCNNGSL